MSTENLPNLKDNKSIVRIETKRIPLFGGIGSGFFVKPDIILTNIHALADRGPVSVKSSDGKTTWKVEGVTAFDVRNDIVAIKVAGEGTPLPIGNSDVVQSSEPISVVGFPDRKYKVTEGTVHSVQKSNKLIRMNVNTSFGSSGSPVLNDKRQVIGIYFQVSNNFGSWAIPSNALKTLLDRLEPAEPLAKWRKRKIIRSYAKYWQGTRNSWKKHYRKAIVDFDKAIILNPKLIDAYEARGIAKSELGDHEGAIVDFDYAITLNPKYTKAYYNRGIAKCKYADSNNNRSVGKTWFGDSESIQGNVERAVDLYQAAIEDCTAAIKLYPEIVEIYHSRGNIQSEMGTLKADQGNETEAQQFYEASIEDYTQVIKRNPEYSVAYNNRAWVKYLLGKSNAAAGNTEVAQALYHAAIIDSSEASKFDPEESAFYHTRGAAKAAMGDSISAIQDFDITLKLNPKHAKTYFDRALAKEALGQQDAAKADFEKAKKLDPDVGNDNR